MKLNFEYDKLFLKKITILIPKYHSNLTSFLTPILGLYGINVKDFIFDFQSKTNFIDFDVIIPISVTITKIKTYSISFKTPYVSFLLSNLNFFSLLDFYKIFFIKYIYNNSYSLNSKSFLIKKNYTLLRNYFATVKRGLVSNYFILEKRVIKDFLNPLALKYSYLYYLNLKKFLKLYYGFFFCFPSYNSSNENLIKGWGLFYKTFLIRLKNKFYNSFFGSNYFFGHNFFLGSENLSFFFSFYQNIELVCNSSLFPIFFKFNLNLLCTTFFKSLISDFIKCLRFQNFYILKILQMQLFKSLKTLSLINLKLLLFLKNINANLSSNFKVI